MAMIERATRQTVVGGLRRRNFLDGNEGAGRLRRMERKPIAVTCGDPSGVGPELIRKCLECGTDFGPLCVIGPKAFLDGLGPRSGGLERMEVGDSSARHEAGRPTLGGARTAIAAMEAAADGCSEGRFSAVVTGPISKAQSVAAGFPFPGQTEFFAAAWGGEPSMAFAGGKLRLVLATWHVPLSGVADALTPDAVRRAVGRAGELARRLGVAAPRIGVAGLNPHAGEGGVLGVEERDWIDPLLTDLRRDEPGLSACLPGDTVFARAIKGEFDVTVAMYHDQGLAPLKVVDFESAVNITLGLRFARTSPDHGTAFDIAGKGVASHTSFANAIRLAGELAGVAV